MAARSVHLPVGASRPREKAHLLTFARGAPKPMMNHTVIDVLIYIFEHFADEDVEILDDHDRLRGSLREAGFESGLVRRALDWLKDLAWNHDNVVETIVEQTTSHRCYSAEEQQKLDPDCQGFLMYLEANGVLGATTRELVIERVMALDAEQIDVEQLKWIVLMVLFNMPGQEDAYFSMEDLVNEDAYGLLH
jgi:Smg protein